MVPETVYVICVILESMPETEALNQALGHRLLSSLIRFVANAYEGLASTDGELYGIWYDSRLWPLVDDDPTGIKRVVTANVGISLASFVR